jgi:hypothetical protein
MLLLQSAPPARAVAQSGAEETCAGDCDGDGQVTIGDLVRAVNIALGSGIVRDCQSLDGDDDAAIAINELVVAVQNALTGCLPEVMRTDYPVGDNPRFVAVADLDGDRVQDLAVSNYNDASVSILLGARDGSFRLHGTTSSGVGPIGIAAGDFDGDERLDLAVSNNTTRSVDTVSILIGHGDGTFANPREIAVGDWPQIVISEDFDGDGALDLAVATDPDGTPFEGDDSLLVLRGGGDGTFAMLGRHGVGGGVVLIVPAQLDDRQATDLIVVNRSDDSVSVLFGNGDGSFQAEQRYPAGPGVHSVALADFDRDGILDLFAANTDAFVPERSASLLRGVGGGGFAEPTYVSVSPGASSVVARDFDGDGNMDVAIATGSTDEVALLFGDGRGAFPARRLFQTLALPLHIAAADFDENGVADLAVADLRARSVSIFFGPQLGWR